MSERVTISDVAREAGVSLMTVSRVVNDKGEISPATRQRVLDVIERLAYRPSSIARGLATRRTGTLGLVVPDISNPFFSDLAGGAEERAYGHGYNLFLCNTFEDAEREIAVLESLEEKRVDGLVLCSSRLHDRELRAVLAHHLAVVTVNRVLTGSDIGAVLVADEAGARAVVGHLLRAGHRAVGLLAGPPASFSGQQRALGYQLALEAAGIAPDPTWVRPCASGVEGGRETACDLLADAPQLTALFCYNDLVAIGALRACAELGYRVPEDLAIVGFDDILMAALVTPALTTCRVPRHELGARAMGLLLDRIQSQVGERPCGRTAAAREVILQPELVVRASAP